MAFSNFFLIIDCMVIKKENVEELRKLVNEQDGTIVELTGRVTSLEQENKILREHVRFFQALYFGPSSEKVNPEDDSGEGESPSHFNEAETESERGEDESGEDDNGGGEGGNPKGEGGNPKRKRGKRKKLPKNLPRERVVIDLKDEDKVCGNGCGGRLECIGEEVSEKLKIIPAKVVVVETVRKKYACRGCPDCLKTAPALATIFPKSMATPELLAFMVTGKYVDGIPLYRMEKVMNRHGIELGRTTMSRWMIKAAEKLEPLKQILREEVLGSDYIHCDETVVQVLKEEGKTPQSNSYMWTQGRSGTKPIILYDYARGRGGEVPLKLLEGFKGFLQVDGYKGYNKVCANEGVVRLGCMKHCRRYFYNAWKHSGKKNIGSRGLGYIRNLYRIEKKIRELPAEEKKRIRQEEAVPVLDKMKEWLDGQEGKHPPKGLAKKAITYALNEWEFLIRYVEDGNLNIDNDFIERAIRPFAIGRKNWLFSDTTSGADASSLWYSLIETAKANGKEPFDYILKVLQGIPGAEKLGDYLALLPFELDDS